MDWGDYDNDGDEDVLIGGTGLDGPLTKVYKNSNGIFSEDIAVSSALTDLTEGEYHWVDYNNDGQLDIFITGNTGNSLLSRLYKNNNGTFSAIGSGISGVKNGSSNWIDYDQDGDLDLLLTGDDGANKISILYNNLNGVFVNASAGITGVHLSSSSWGDIDNDGDLDLVISGHTGDGPIMEYYQNKKGTLSKMNDAFTANSLSVNSIVDYDNDNDMDILVSGSTSSGNIFKSYKNFISTKNLPPAAPVFLSSIVMQDSVTVYWRRGSDPSTLRKGLSYGVRVSKTRNGDEIYSVKANDTGKRKTLGMGNVLQDTLKHLNGLKDGKYFWSVQSIDNNYTGSSFSSADSFKIAVPPAAPGVLSGVPGNKKTKLIWGKSKEPDASGYNIYRSIMSPANMKIISLTGGPAADTTFIDTLVNNNLTYYYRITAIDSAGNESIFSNEISLKPLPPILALAPDTLEFELSDSTKTMYILNAGYGNIDWTISENLDWVSILPLSGSITDPFNAKTSDKTYYNHSVSVQSEWIEDSETFEEYDSKIGKKLAEEESQYLIKNSRENDYQADQEKKSAKNYSKVRTNFIRSNSFTTDWNVDSAVVTIDTTGISSGVKFGKIYANSGTLKDSVIAALTVPNENAPKFVDNYPLISNIQYNYFDLSFKINKDGKVFYVVIPDTLSEPTAEEIMMGNAANGTTPLYADSVSMLVNEVNDVVIKGLTQLTNYNVYLVGKDNSEVPNYSVRGKKLSVTTTRRKTQYFVNADGSQDFITIQSAIDSLVSLDTISVYEGTYKEKINFKGKSMRLLAVGDKEETIIDAESSGAALRLISGESSNTKIAGFTIRNGLADQKFNNKLSGGGIFINGAQPILENLIIENNTAAYSGGGLFIHNADSVIIKNLYLLNNTAEIGAAIHTDSPIHISNSIFDQNNNTVNGGSIFVENQSSNSLLTIINSSIMRSVSNNTSYGSEIHLLNSINIVLLNSLIYNTQYQSLSLNSSNIKVVHSLLYGKDVNNSQIIKNVVSQIDSSSVIISDPLLSFENGLPYAPSIYSPIYGKGVEQYNFSKGSNFYSLVAPSKDILGYPRPNPDNSALDLGGYEFNLKSQYPLAGNIYDGNDKTKDLDLILDTTGYSLSAYWDPFIDDGKVVYEYALGNSKSSLNNLIDWSNLGSSTSLTLTNYEIIKDITYYFSVRGIDTEGQLSQTITSDGQVYTIDILSPTITEVFEFIPSAPAKDIDWVKPEQDSIGINISGIDDVGIDYFSFALGDSSNPNKYSQWSNNTDSIYYLINPTIGEGIKYNFWGKIVDFGGNVSDSIYSDGFQIDGTAPSGGKVFDGGTGLDIDVSNNVEAISFDWTSFEDSLSGIAKYFVSVIDSANGTKLVENIDVGLNTEYTATNLSLTHGNKYFTSVFAEDLVGNASLEIQSDGFFVDQFVGPPVITKITPGENSFFDLYNAPTILLEFNENIKNAYVSVYARNKGALNKTISIDNKVVQIVLNEPVASLDTIDLSNINIFDLAGVKSNDTTFTYYTRTLGDYNNDKTIDGSDLANFTTIWNDNDISQELGPTTGIVPHLSLEPDNKLDLRDIMAFTKMWHWSAINGSSKIIYSKGAVPFIEQNGKKITISYDSYAMAGEFRFVFDPNYISLDTEVEKIEPNNMVLYNDSNQGTIDYLFANLDKSVIMENEFSLTKIDGRTPQLIIDYTLIDSSGQIFSSGSYDLVLRPIPEQFALHQNYPNPFNPITTIHYDLPEATTVNFIIYDIMGRKVFTLMNQQQPAGYQTITWNARNTMGNHVSAGIYFYQLQAKDFVKVRKMILLK